MTMPSAIEAFISMLPDDHVDVACAFVWWASYPETTKSTQREAGNSKKC